MGRQESAVRCRILLAACRLWRERGFDSVGVDLLAAEAEASKPSLYAHFGSRAGLIAAVLQELEDSEGARLRRETVEAAEDAAGELRAFLPVFAGWFHPDEFRGSLFLAAAAHLSDAEHPARQVAAAHFTGMRAWLAALAHDAGATRPEQLAQALWLLAQGAVADAWVSGDLDAITTAIEAGNTLINAALGVNGQTPSARRARRSST